MSVANHRLRPSHQQASFTCGRREGSSCGASLSPRGGLDCIGDADLAKTSENGADRSRLGATGPERHDHKAIAFWSWRYGLGAPRKTNPPLVRWFPQDPRPPFNPARLGAIEHATPRYADAYGRSCEPR